MRTLLAVLVLLAALAGAGEAAAHPLGNFTTNRYSRIELSGDRVSVVYVLDLAEIPTFQARGERERLGLDRYAESLATRIRRGLSLELEGEPRTLRELRHAISLPRGQGGLRTTRLELVLDAGRTTAGPLAYADRTFPDRIGWREIVLRTEGGATARRSSVPAASVSGELRAYPRDLLASPPDVRTATAVVRPGAGPGAPPSLAGAGAGPADTGFAALVSAGELGPGVILLSLLAALFWGAAHALTPGHGKTIVAAYLVGTQGRARDALALGGIVTVTHTIGVFALGLATLTLSALVVPEQLYPWLNLVSALLVVAVGIVVVRARFRGTGGHHHDHAHLTADEHARAHVPARGTGTRGLLAVGISGGLLPCPTALVVLLGAISLHRVAFGLVLIVAFSVGLASVISGIGLLALGVRNRFSHVTFDGPLVRALPGVSALLVCAIGIAMTFRALPALV